jgi:hypothetical protein
MNYFSTDLNCIFPEETLLPSSAVSGCEWVRAGGSDCVDSNFFR